MLLILLRILGQLHVVMLIYKILSKILANRLKEMLEDLVSLNQDAFISNRSIMDNILICQDLVHNYHRQEGPPRCLFKLNLWKAYDTVNWGFLTDIMKELGFPENFISLIYRCLSTARFSINFSSKPKGFFPGKRGIR